MLIYIIIILIATLFAYAANGSLKNRSLFYICSFFALFIPAFFAGCRDLTVGYDVLFYEYDIYKDAHFSINLNELIERNVTIELFYLIINYIAVSLYDNIHFTLGFISFITLFFAYLACYNLRKSIPLWLLYSGFLFMFYATSMNILRQSVAIAVCFYAYSIMRTKGIGWSFFLIAIIAFISHTTAIFAICMICIFRYMSKLTEQSFSKIFTLFIIIIGIVFYSISQLLLYLTLLLGKDYTIYLDSSATNEVWGTTIIPYTYIILISISIIAYHWAKKGEIITTYNMQEFKSNTAIFILCIILGATLTGSMLRLISYFVTINIYEIGLITVSKKLPIRQRQLFKAILFILFIILFFRTFDSGVKYSSSILSL